MAVTNDPFAPENDEAQTEQAPEPEDTFDAPPAEAPEPKKAPTKRAAKKATAKVASDDDEDPEFYPYTLSLKGHGGFDAPMLVLRGKTIGDIADLMEKGNNDDLKRLMSNAAGAAKFFNGLFPDKANAQSRGGSGGGQRSGGAPQEAKEAPGGEERFCKHGKMEFKSGISKAGNKYELFSCTAPRDEQCPAQYLNSKKK